MLGLKEAQLISIAVLLLSIPLMLYLRRRPALQNTEGTVAKIQHTAILYTREGCCLCDRARAVLLRLKEEYDLRIQEVDITGDPQLLDSYQFAIPVVVLDGEVEFGVYVDDYCGGQRASHSRAPCPLRRPAVAD
ncbi:MAG TPA: glutaredoxin family protein [Chloroflexota bacterium]|nr:glutaredoxin family protein [Chloroflexota bacterium]